MRQFNFWLDDETRELLRERSESSGLSIGALIRRAIDNYLKPIKYNNQRPK